MKQKLIGCLCCLSIGVSAQNFPFTVVTDPGNPAVTFTNTAAPYKGVAWLDMTGDNFPDLFLSPRFLFKNNGNGSFTQLPSVNGAASGQIASGSSWSDIDNDGDLDLITTSIASGMHYNDGNENFSVNTSDLPGFDPYCGWDCCTADVDNNGRMDLLFVHAANFHPASCEIKPCKLYLQQTNGSFSAVTGYEFTNQVGPYTIPVWADYDQDGDVDLFIGSGPAGSTGPDYCYKNLLKETGAFSLQRLSNPPFNQPQDGQVYNFPDADNDGDLDICLTNYNGAATRFWENMGNGNYVAKTTPFTDIAMRLANTWGDLDNDGDLDVAMTRDGFLGISFYQNTGSLGFLSAQNLSFNSGNQSISGMAMADYDNDGDLDLYVNGDNNGRHLIKNDLNNGYKWMILTLKGVASNTAAIGARLRVKATIDGSPVWQTREVSAHNSFQSQNDLRQHIGLKNASQVDSLEVYWPSGQVQRFGNLATNKLYQLTEGNEIGVFVGVSVVKPDSRLVELVPNPFTEFMELYTDHPEDVVDILLTNTIGQVHPIEKQEMVGKIQLRPADSLPSGIYFIQIKFKNLETVTLQTVKN